MFALDFYITVSKKTSVPKSAPSSRGLQVPRDRNTLYRYDSKPSQSVPSYEALTPQNLDAPEVLPTADDVEPMEIRSIWSKLSKGERVEERLWTLFLLWSKRAPYLSLPNSSKVSASGCY